MPAATKKNESKVIIVRMGGKDLEMEVVPIHEVKSANTRIQKKVLPVIKQSKRIRRAAEMTASKIFLNA